MAIGFTTNSCASAASGEVDARSRCRPDRPLSPLRTGRGSAPRLRSGPIPPDPKHAQVFAEVNQDEIARCEKLIRRHIRCTPVIEVDGADMGFETIRLFRSGRNTPVIARICATILVALTTYFTASSNARAEDNYPGRPVRIIVPTPPGGPVDVVARLVAHYLSGALSESAFVDNRPGAGNTIGSREAARAAPDGYTLHYSSISGLVLAPMLHKEAGYDAIGSFAPTAAAGVSAIILVVHPSFPPHSVAELVAYAKSH